MNEFHKWRMGEIVDVLREGAYVITIIYWNEEENGGKFVVLHI